MRELAAGSEDALRELYARYAPLVFGIATRSLERAAAEEVVQDVFLSLWRGAERFDAELGSLRGWLLQIAHRRILNELRGRRRRVQLEPEPEGDGALADPEPGPQGLLWLSFRRAAVRNAIDALPPAQRQALSLAGRRPHSALAYHRVELVGQRIHKVADVGLLERVPNICVWRAGTPVLHVLADRCAE